MCFCLIDAHEIYLTFMLFAQPARVYEVYEVTFSFVVTKINFSASELCYIAVFVEISYYLFIYIFRKFDRLDNFVILMLHTNIRYLRSNFKDDNQPKNTYVRLSVKVLANIFIYDW